MQQDKGVAIVTGAGRGIGRAIALHLAEDGFSIAVNDLDRMSTDLVTKEVRATGAKAIAVAADVGDQAAVVEMVARAGAELGPIAVMVNNAGIIRIGPVLDATADDLDDVFRVNVHGMLFGMQAAARAMIAAGRGGKIINACSIAGHEAPPLSSVYCASKFAVRALTVAAAREWGVHGITVNAFCPGLVETEMNDYIDRATTAATGQTADDRRAKIIERVALGRSQSVDDVAGLVSFLASPAADYMTGQCPIIDGGLVFR